MSTEKPSDPEPPQPEPAASESAESQEAIVGSAGIARVLAPKPVGPERTDDEIARPPAAMLDSEPAAPNDSGSGNED